VASVSGQIAAFGFIGLGIFTIFSGNFFNGLWLAFIGWFLQNAAASSYAQVTMQSALKGVTASQAMHREPPMTLPLTPLSRLVEDEILGRGQRTFFVAQDCRLEGMLTLNDIAAIPRAKWGLTTVQQAMIPASRLISLPPQTELLQALREMDTHHIAHIPITEDGCLIGVLSREGVVHYLRLRSELRM
jgi:signal-transduction protein with cAMP-binding, CBS, and nucleotidyltransferase domain